MSDNYPQPPTKWWGKMRDRITYHVCNWIFRHIATEWYCATVSGIVRIGLNTLNEEVGKK